MSAVACTADGLHVVAGSVSGTLVRLDVRGGMRAAGRYKGAAGSIREVAAAGGAVACVGLDRMLRVYGAADGALRKRVYLKQRLTALLWGDGGDGDGGGEGEGEGEEEDVEAMLSTLPQVGEEEGEAEGEEEEEEEGRRRARRRRRCTAAAFSTTTTTTMTTTTTTTTTTTRRTRRRKKGARPPPQAERPRRKRRRPQVCCRRQ